MERVPEPSLNILSRRVIGSAMEVLNTLGPGFLEKVYERALVLELGHQGLRVESQVELPVYYRGSCVGTYQADLLVEDDLLIELKSVFSFNDAHMAQCLNYLSAADRRFCLLLNFRYPRLQWRRVVR